jgi:potassium efflux system protein
MRQEVRRVQSNRLGLESKLLVDPAEEADRRIARSVEAVEEAHREDVRELAIDALNRRAELLKELDAAYERFAEEVLLDLHARQHLLVALVADYVDFIDEHILWIQSAAPLSVHDAPRAGLALAWLFDLEQWWRSADELWHDAKSRPLPPLGGLIVLLLLMVVRRRARAQVRSLAKKVSRATTDRFGLSIAVAALTVVIAVVWPLGLWLLSWRLGAVEDGTEFTLALSVGFRHAAEVLLTLMLIHHLCRPDGLAEAHFRWRSSNLKLTRRHLRWLIPAILPLTFVVWATDTTDTLAHHNSLGRLAFIAGMITLAVFLQRLFRPHSGILKGLIASHRGGWLDRLRYLWFGIIVGAPLALAVAAGLGYFYTAENLISQLNDSALLILGGVVVYSLLLRWLYVTQRKLAIDQARKKLAAQAKARAEEQAAAEGNAPAEASPLAQIDETEIDVAATSAQARRLLRTTITFLLVVGILFMWADVLPALGMLDEVTLWRQVDPGAVATVGDDGAALIDAATTTTESGVVRITLADLGMALIILIATLFVSRNIPGLLEFTLLQRLPLTAGGRYAITTLARYSLVVIGVVLAFNAIGIGWSKVQFLAAAITVGLGFGLQEIFANFVSGLILLFERPIRVGDTVTVGSVNGTVSRIRIRATTITDWDRKELVIPNREFVTGQIVNWSLSDSILRLTVAVGIAYGSDTKLARQLLLKVAEENKVVLKDPEPRAVFLGFGESSLDFELRVFIPHIDHFLNTRSELHFAIDEAFREAGIEIAFPQRDLHVRSIQAAFPTASDRVDPPTPAD